MGGGLTTILSQIPFFRFTNQKRETFGFGERRRGREIVDLFPCPQGRAARGPQTQPALSSSSSASPLCSQVPPQLRLLRNRGQAVLDRLREKGIRIEELKRRGDRGFPKHSRQSMNHMQMTPKAQAQLGGGGQGVQPWQKQRPSLSEPPSPARSWQGRAGRDRADFKPEQWAGTIYKLSRKTHTHTYTHKATTSPPPPYFSDQQSNEHYFFFALFQGPLSLPGHAHPLFTFCSPGSRLQEAGKTSLILKETTPGRAEEDRLGEAGTSGGHLFPHQSSEAQACLARARNCLKTCPKRLQGTSLETVRGDLKSRGWPQDATTARPHPCLKLQYLLPKSGSHVSPTRTPRPKLLPQPHWAA